MPTFSVPSREVAGVFFVALRFAFLVVPEGNRTVVFRLSVSIGVSVAEIDGL